MKRGKILASLAVAGILTGTAAFAQPELTYVSGSLVAIVRADTGGTEFSNCTGADTECDLDVDWSSASISVNDPDYTDCLEPPETACHAIPSVDIACATSNISYLAVSASQIEFVWSPKLHGRCHCSEAPSYTGAYAYNDVLFAIYDSGHPNRRFRIEVQVEVVEEENYVNTVDCDETAGSVLLSVSTVLSGSDASLVAPAYDCPPNTPDVAPYSTDPPMFYLESYSEGACAEFWDEPTTWQAVGYVCESEQFYLGFEFKLLGSARHDSAADYDIQSAPCDGLGACADAEELHIILRFRGVIDGTCP